VYRLLVKSYITPAHLGGEAFLEVISHRTVGQKRFKMKPSSLKSAPLFKRGTGIFPTTRFSIVVRPFEAKLEI
jgi:hypothetical protein